METSYFRTFIKPEFFYKIKCEYLAELFAPYRKELSDYGVLSLSDEKETNIDIEKLISVLINPKNGLSAELVESLYYISEMSTVEGFDLIQEKIEKTELGLSIADNVTIEELPLLVWVKEKEIIKRLHAERCMQTQRSTEFFSCSKKKSIGRNVRIQRSAKYFEKALIGWFGKRRRGKDVNVFIFQKDASISLLIRHNAPLIRRIVIQRSEVQELEYRPTKYDTLVYNQFTGDLRINVCSKYEREFYLRVFGKIFFDDILYFDIKKKISLDPIISLGADSVLCNDVKGIDWIKLREIHINRGGTQKGIEVIKSQDLYSSFIEWNRSLPESTFLSKACFQAKFANSQKPRYVTLSRGNKVNFSRDSDSDVLTEWMFKRGFIRNGGEEANDSGRVMAVS